MIINDSSTVQFIIQELDWFFQVLETRFKLYFGHECAYQTISQIPMPDVVGDTPYAQFIQSHQLNFAERLILILSLTPHLRPQLLDQFFIKNQTYDREFTEFGGICENPHRGFLPTGETAIFLLAGDDLQDRLNYFHLFGRDHLFAQKNIITLEKFNDKAPFLSGLLMMQDKYLDNFTGFYRPKVHYNINFPAQPISTELTWDDLVLPTQTLNEIDEILIWIKYGDVLLYDWELYARIKPGYRAIFYGPSGTGKTLTAALLGKATDKEVYRIDLSKVVSKYIGETEKNLSKVFDAAENKQWILFFDEADALFSRRTNSSSAHDRYANQEVSYLLQRVEDFPGVVILATNMRNNLDEAFIRRFQAIIHFPMPRTAERLRLWQHSFSKHCVLNRAVDLHYLAEKYELTAGSMMNVIRYSSLAALKRGNNEIFLRDIEIGIRKEFQKEGKTVN